MWISVIMANWIIILTTFDSQEKLVKWRDREKERDYTLPLDPCHWSYYKTLLQHTITSFLLTCLLWNFRFKFFNLGVAIFFVSYLTNTHIEGYPIGTLLHHGWYICR